MSLVPARHCPRVLVLTLACASTARVSKYRYRTCIGFVEFLYEPTLDQRIHQAETIITARNNLIVCASKLGDRKVSSTLGREGGAGRGGWMRARPGRGVVRSASDSRFAPGSDDVAHRHRLIVDRLAAQEVRTTAKQIEKRLVELRGEPDALKPGGEVKVADGLRAAGHSDARVYGQWRTKALLAAALAQLEDKEVRDRWLLCVLHAA